MNPMRPITDTADRLRPGDRIQNPDGKWMQIADITDASATGTPGRYAVLLANPAGVGYEGARLMLINPGYVLDIRVDPHRIQRPHTASEATKVRRAGLGYEVWDSAGLAWAYILPADLGDPFDSVMEATEAKLNMLCPVPEPAADPEVERIVTALRNSTYQRTAEHVLDAEPSVVDKAIELGLIRVVKVQPTTYNRKGERMLAAA